MRTPLAGDWARQATMGHETAARKHRPDYGLVVLSALLLSIGLVVVYSISPALAQAYHVSSTYYVEKQLVAIGLSIVAFVIMARVPLGLLKRSYKPLLVIAGLMTLVALVTPNNPLYPAHRWVRAGGFSFQSVELLKFAVLVWLAGLLADRISQDRVAHVQETLKPLVTALLVIGVAVAYRQSDLGSTAVIMAMMVAMTFIAGFPLRRLLLIGLAVAIALVIFIAPVSYRRERVLTFMNPEANCQTSSYQACQALISIGSGGIVGLGLGRSVQAYGYQPEAANDSIFAIFSEKFGFIGVTVLLGLFVAFFSRLKSIAERASDDFSRLLVIGVLAWLSIQAIINIGGMIGLLPLKGITLPFISYGGTSVVFVAGAVGMVFQISQYAAYSAPRLSSITNRSRVHSNAQKYENSNDRRRLRGAYHPNPSSRS